MIGAHMYVIQILPLTNAPLPETLTYYSRDNLPVGSIIPVPVGHQTITGIVLTVLSLQSAKALIKNATYQIKTLPTPKNKPVQTWLGLDRFKWQKALK